MYTDIYTCIDLAAPFVCTCMYPSFLAPDACANSSSHLPHMYAYLEHLT